MRRLERRTPHRLVHAAAIAAILHFLWIVKADLASPLLHGSIRALLLAALRPARPSTGS